MASRCPTWALRSSRSPSTAASARSFPPSVSASTVASVRSRRAARRCRRSGASSFSPSTVRVSTRRRQRASSRPSGSSSRIVTGRLRRPLRLSNGARINPTKDHPTILRALDTVVGQRDLAEVTQFRVRPSEIVDVTRDLNRGGGATLESVAARECGQDPPDPYCRQRLITDVSGQALYFEGQATASLGMLRTIVENMNSARRPQDAAAHQRRHARERRRRRPPGSRRARHPGRQGSRESEHDDLHALHRDEPDGAVLGADEDLRPEPCQLEPRQLDPGTLARAVRGRGGRDALHRSGRQCRAGAGTDQDGADVVLPAGRRTGRRRS